MTERSYSHILVPTDFGPAQRAAYRVALAAGSGTGATVTLLHVAPGHTGEAEDDYTGMDAIRLLHRAAGGRVGWDSCPEYIAAETAELESRLKGEMRGHESGAARVRYALRRGDRVAEVVRFVREANVDLLVVLAPAPGWIPRWRRSLADRLARATPVEVVRVTPAAKDAPPLPLSPGARR